MKPRLVRPEEVSLLADLHAQCFQEAWDAKAMTELMAMPGALAMADIDGKGFVLVRAAGDESEVLTLAVSPAARRRGLATELVLAAGDEVAKSGVTAMFLEVAVGNSPAIALYKRLGFAEVGYRKAYYVSIHGVREDALVLRARVPLLRVVN